MRKLHTVTLAAVVSLAVTAMVGCGGDPVTPEPLEPERTGPTASDNDSEPAPEPEPEPEPETPPESPEEFVEYFIGLVNESHETLDPEPIIALSGPDCLTCNSLIESLPKMAAGGGTYEGDPTVTYSNPISVGGTDPLVVLIDVSWETYSYTEEEGGEATTLEGGDYRYEFKLEAGDEGWIVVDWVGLPPAS